MEPETQHMNAAIAPKTRPIVHEKAAGVHSRDRQVFWLAITLSAAMHLAAYVLTPHFAVVWKDAAATSYDAILLPPSRELLAMTSSQTNRPAKRRSAPKTPSHPKQPAMPVEAPDTAQAGVPEATESQATGDSTAVNAEESVVAAGPAAAPVAEAIAPATPPVETAPAAAEAAIAAPPPELPARIAISYKASSSISDGVADYTWTRTGNKYEVDSSLQASGFVVALLAGILHQVSSGEITAAGLAPSNFMIRRGDSEPETAEFLRASNELKLTRSGKSRLLPLPAKIQDTQSFLFQLAFDAPRLRSPEDRLEVLVTNARKVYRHQFRQLGETAVETRFGPVNTLHLLSEAADPEDAYEVWLSLDHYYLPVKLKFYAGRFPIELIAASIRSTP